MLFKISGNVKAFNQIIDLLLEVSRCPFFVCNHPLIQQRPEKTARVAKAAFPKGNRYMRLRDELGIFYNDEEFTELYPDRGKSAIVPWRLTMILIIQFLFGKPFRKYSLFVNFRFDLK